jgi:hypothetical protein
MDLVSRGGRVLTLAQAGQQGARVRDAFLRARPKSVEVVPPPVGLRSQQYVEFGGENVGRFHRANPFVALDEGRAVFYRRAEQNSRKLSRIVCSRTFQTLVIFLEGPRCSPESCGGALRPRERAGSIQGTTNAREA